MVCLCSFYYDIHNKVTILISPSVILSLVDVLPDGADSDDTTAARSKITSCATELCSLLTIAWPVIFTQAGQLLIAPMAVFFCGHLGHIDLDGVALANSIFCGLGILVCAGMATACDTLFSQIYGSPQRHTLGMTLQRSLLIMFLAALLCISVHINTTPLLILMKQDPIVSKLAGDYMLFMIPATISYFLYSVLTKYIQCQSIVLPTMMISKSAMLLCAGLHVLLVRHLSMGLTGSALAQSLSHVFILISTIMYILMSKMYEGTWCALSMECLLDWGAFMKLAASGLVMLCSVGFTWEAGIILAGLLGTIQQGAQAVVFNVRMVTFMLSIGTGIAASVRMGQRLGAGDAAGAKQSAHVAFMTTTVISVVTGGLCYLLQYQIPTWISDDDDVMEAASDALPIVALFFMLDGIYAIYSTTFRSSGRQLKGAVIQCIGYAIGNAVAVYLMFYKDYGIKGFWIALSSTLLSVNLVYTILFVRTDWDDQVQKAKQRVQSSGNGKPLLSEKSDNKDKLTLEECETRIHRAAPEETKPPPENDDYYWNQRNEAEKCLVSKSTRDDLKSVESDDDDRDDSDDIDDDSDDNDDGGDESLTRLILRRLVITVIVLSLLIVSASYRYCYMFDVNNIYGR